MAHQSPKMSLQMYDQTVVLFMTSLIALYTEWYWTAEVRSLLSGLDWIVPLKICVL